MNAQARISVRNLTKVFRTKRGMHKALDNVSLEIAAGEFVVLLGPSGCGKTTLLRCIAGLEEPDDGEIYIDGKCVFSREKQIWVAPEKRNYAMVFQSYALWPHLSVIENVAYPLISAKIPKAEAQARAREGLERVGLVAYAEGYPGQMSGGQQQRVALARAIVASSGLVLFDEPLSNLDAKVRERLRIELLELQAQIGFSAVYVTHDQAEALAMADRVAVMGVGRIAQIGPATEIYEQPASRYVADFVGSANEIAGEIASCGTVVATQIGALHPAKMPEGARPGDRVWVMLRPEHVLMSGLEEAENTPNQLQGRVMRSLFLGASRNHLVDINGFQLQVMTQGALQAGAELQLICAPHNVHVFPHGGAA